MAARENQGLQIALISFVILTILLSVFTYLLFSNWKEADLKMAAANKDASDAKSKQAATQADIDTLKAVMGEPAADDVTKIKNHVLELANEPALGLSQLPDADKNQAKIYAALLKGVKERDNTIDSVNAAMDKLRKDTDKAIAEATNKLKAAEAARETAVADLTKEQTLYRSAVEAKKAEMDQLVNDKTLKNKETDALKAKFERDVADAQAKVTQANADVKRIKEELKKYYHLDPSTSGGIVTWINQRDNMAYINLGWDDGLHRRITFSVYPQGTTDVAKATSKGKIEVINVTGPHLAEARIIDNPTNNPLLPGDMIHTEGWHPGQHEHFAIAGMIDIDGTGRDQTEKLHDLILANGGFVDAEIVINPKALDTTTGRPSATVKRFGPNGEGMTVNTRYLILGEMTTEKKDSQDRLSASNTMMTEATRLNVEVIGLQKFLAMMGYTPRAAAAGGEGGPGAAAAAPADNGFRARKPPTRAKDDSAF
jgi:hypothetical protein